MKKLKLKDIKVSSFITNLDGKTNQLKVLGGSAFPCSNDDISNLSDDCQSIDTVFVGCGLPPGSNNCHSNACPPNNTQNCGTTYNCGPVLDTSYVSGSQYDCY